MTGIGYSVLFLSKAFFPDLCPSPSPLCLHRRVFLLSRVMRPSMTRSLFLTPVANSLQGSISCRPCFPGSVLNVTHWPEALEGTTFSTELPSKNDFPLTPCCPNYFYLKQTVLKEVRKQDIFVCSGERFLSQHLAGSCHGREETSKR